MSELLIGVDLGGTGLRAGVVAPDGRVVAGAKRLTPSPPAAEVVADAIAETVRAAAEAAGTTVGSVAGIGVAAAGAIERDAGVVLAAPNLQWRGAPLGALLQARLGRPIVLENDVNAAAWAEWKLGAGAGERDLLAVWIGTGIGGGLILGGRLYSGPLRTAGEIGHMVVFPDGPEGARKLEQVAARSIIARDLLEAGQRGEPTLLRELSNGFARPIGSPMIAEAFRAGDALTVKIVTRAMELIGSTIASVVTLLSLQRIVLGGSLTDCMGHELCDIVQARARRDVFPPELGGLTVAPSRLGDDAGVIGAALLGNPDVC
jgi:glucokinase